MRLAPTGAATLRTAGRAAVGRWARDVARMARRPVGHPVRPNLGPAPATRSACEDGPPAEPAEVGPKLADAGFEFALFDVAGRDRPEDWPIHPLGEGVVSVHQAGDPRPLAVGAASDVAGQRRRHARPAAAMDEDSDQRAVAEGSGSLVEPEGALDIAVLVSQSAALGEDICEVELGGLPLRWIAEQLGERVDGASRTPPRVAIRAPTADLLPCIDRSGMRAARGCEGGRAELRNVHGCEPRRSRLADAVGRCPFGRANVAWRASGAAGAGRGRLRQRCPQRRQTRQRGSGACSVVTAELARGRAIEAVVSVRSVGAFSLIASVRKRQADEPTAAQSGY